MVTFSVLSMKHYLVHNVAPKLEKHGGNDIQGSIQETRQSSSTKFASNWVWETSEREDDSKVLNWVNKK